MTVTISFVSSLITLGARELIAQIGSMFTTAGTRSFVGLCLFPGRAERLCTRARTPSASEGAFYSTLLS